MALHENNAERLGTIALDDPGRHAAHLAHQAEGDALREELAATHGGDVGELLERLDAADLIADRLFIEAISRMTMEVDRLAAWALAQSGDVSISAVGEDVVRAAVAAEDPHSARRADVRSAMAASLHDPGQVIATAGADGRERREARRMWERSVDRAAIGEWSASLERGDLELAVDRLGGPALQLEQEGEDDVDAGHETQQEVE